MSRSETFSQAGQFFHRLFHRIAVALGAVTLAFVFFLVLPLMQTISKPLTTDLIVQNIDTADVPPPPPPLQEEKKKEPEPEDKPPELTEETKPLDLSQLELALNPNAGLGENWMGGDFAVKLNTVASDKKDVDALFSIADLDETPRVIYQPSPILNKEMRQKVPGTVYVIFIVDQTGRVDDPIVQKSSDPVFERSAINAVKQWKFEPGKRNGRAVKFRMRVPISFAKG
jgi:protein TonB